MLGGAGRRQRMVRATCWLLALLGLLNLFWLTRQESQVDPPATRGQARASGFRDLRPRVPGPDDCAFPDRKLKPSLRDQGMNPQGYREYLAADGSVLIHIPAGDYLAAEAPDARGWTGRKTRKIHLQGYHIGKFEDTNATFAASAKRDTPPSSTSGRPTPRSRATTSPSSTPRGGQPPPTASGPD